LRARGRPTGDNDLWIAATALAAEAILVTENPRDFSSIPRLRLGAQARPASA
jgi:predicted nucleic acid-binding protein